MAECERLWPERRTLVEPYRGIEIVRHWQEPRTGTGRLILTEWAELEPGDISLPEDFVVRERFTRKPLPSRYVDLLLKPTWISPKQLMGYLRGR